MDALETAHTLLERSEEFAERAAQTQWPQERDQYSWQSKAAMEYAAQYATVSIADSMVRIADALDGIVGYLDVESSGMSVRPKPPAKPAKLCGRSGPKPKKVTVPDGEE